jgi:hypothetical protein
MQQMLLDRVDSPSAWRRKDLEEDSSWCLRITPAQEAELSAAAGHVISKGLKVPDFTRDDFPLPELGNVLTGLSEDLEKGRGVVLIRGLPFDRLDETRAAILLWGICSYFGRATPQHAAVNLGGYRDNLVAHIVNQGQDYTQLNVHGSLTSAEQMPHCDPADLVALLCVRPAADGGGVSRIVSSMALYNEILKRYPHVLDALYEGFYHDLRKNAAKEGAEVTPYRIPVYSHYEGLLSCNFNSKTAEAGTKKLGRPYTPAEQEAINTMIDLATNPDFAYDMALDTGDLQLLNNYTVLHSRSAWHDPDAYEKKRVMLRLWLKAHHARPLAPGFAGGYVTGSKYDVSAVGY